MGTRNHRSTRGTLAAGAIIASLLVAGAVAVPTALAQQGKPGQELRKRELWWNDSGWVMRLELTNETRSKMDQVYASHQPELEKHPAGMTRNWFFDSLAKGDVAASEQALVVWSSAAHKAAEIEGDMKIGILKLLSPEQRAEFFESGGGNVARSLWKPKGRWPLRVKQKSE